MWLRYIVTNGKYTTMSMGMQIEEIKTAILALPDKEIGPLHNWLQDYYDGEVWDRQIENDFKELGAEKFVQVLQSGMAQASEKRQAALRLMNNMQFRSDADREQCLNDFQLLIGESLLSDSSSAKTV